MVPKWGPRLARLYSADIRQLEAKHADNLSPGAKTWEQAIEQLYARMVKVGPARGTRLFKQAAEYLNGVDGDERAHLVLACGGRGSPNSHLVVASFGVGDHPDPNVHEQGLGITLHILHCSRARPRCAVGIPVAFVSRHALNRLFERGDDITENSHASSAFAFIAVLGYLTHCCERLADSGLYMRFSGLLAAGALHSFSRTCPDGRSFEECVYDVRTVLPADEIGPARQALLDQGTIAAAACSSGSGTKTTSTRRHWRNGFRICRGERTAIPRARRKGGADGRSSAKTQPRAAIRRRDPSV